MKSNLSGFKKSGNVLRGADDINVKGCISMKSIELEMDMLNILHDSVRKTDSVLFLPESILNSMDRAKTNEAEKILESVNEKFFPDKKTSSVNLKFNKYDSLSDHFCKGDQTSFSVSKNDMERVLLNFCYFRVPTFNTLSNFWLKYRSSDMVIAQNCQKFTQNKIMDYSAICFPRTISGGEYMNHFVLFVAYLDLKRIVVYDSMEDINPDNRKGDFDLEIIKRINLASDSENEYETKKIPEAGSVEYQILKTFHLIENFIRALYVVERMRRYTTKVNMDNENKSLGITENLDKASRFLDFKFLSDGYPVIQEGITCGLYVIYGMQSILLNWPSRFIRKNGVYKMNFDFNSDSCNSLYFPVDIRNRRDKLLYVTPDISHQSFIAHMCNVAIIEMCMSHVKRYACTSVDKTVLLLSSISTYSETSEFHKLDIAIYKEIIDLFRMKRKSPQFRYMRDISINRSLESSKHAMGKIVSDVNLHGFFLPHDFSDDIVEKSLEDTIGDKSKDVVIWVFPSNPQEMNSILQKKISRSIKKCISSIDCLIIVVPGSFFQIFYKVRKDKFKEVKNRTDIFMKTFKRINYVLETEPSKVYIPNRPSVNQLIEVMVTKNMKSDHCFNFTVQLPPTNCKRLAWMRCSGGWLPYSYETKQKKKK